jgi:outer membrane protein assembly factor BamB
LWDVRYNQGRYNSASPIIDGQTLIYAGPAKGVTAEKMELKEGKLVPTEAWKHDGTSVQFNTPVLRDGVLYGISNTGSVFAVSTDGGKLAWSNGGTPAPGGGERGPEARPAEGERGPGERGGPGGRGPGGRGPGGFGPGGMRGGRGGGGGYGSVVDAGKVLFALTPAGKLIVFEPSDKEFKQLATYEVGSNTYAYPIPSGNGVYVKDKDNVTFWTVE